MPKNQEQSSENSEALSKMFSQSNVSGDSQELMKKLSASLTKGISDGDDQLKSSSKDGFSDQPIPCAKMPAYIGTKVVSATPMDNVTFNSRYRKNGDVDCETANGYLVVYEDGYTSWSPKEVFERCYRLITQAERQLI